MPTGEGGQEKQADKGKDDGNDTVTSLVMMNQSWQQNRNLHQIWEYNHIFKLCRQPDQIQGIIVNCDLLRQRRRIVTAQPGTAIGVDADSEIADACL